MSNEEINKQDLAYSILEVKYIKAMGREVSMDPRKNSDLYPFGWFTNGNLAIKARILLEAIEKKCLIVETIGYLEIEEGVRNERNKGVDR